MLHVRDFPEYSLRAGPVHSYTGMVTRLGPPVSCEEAASKLQSLSDDTHPIFTKETLRDVSEQMKRVRRNEIKVVSIKGVDGVPIEFSIETGDIHQSSKPGTEFIVLHSSVSYETFHSLTTNVKTEPPLAYCHIRITHIRALRDISTKRLYKIPSIKSNEETETFLHSYLQEWKTSSAYQQLRSSLISTLKTTIKVNKVVGFAFGSIALNEFSIRSAFQHALVITLREITIEKYESKMDDIPCYVQDPIYTDIDRVILDKHGVKVVDDPDGFLEVDNSTLVVSCGPNAPIKQIVADIAYPAVIIWCNTPINGPFTSWTDPDSPRSTKLINDYYDEVEFPGDREVFGPLAILIRRRQITKIPPEDQNSP